MTKRDHASEEDRKRSQAIVKYLIKALGLSTDKKNIRPLKDLFPGTSGTTAENYLVAIEQGTGDRILGIGQLIDFLVSLRNKETEDSDRALSQEEEFLLVQKLMMLSPSEKQKLGGDSGEAPGDDAMLYQALENIRLYNVSPQIIRRFYEASLSIDAVPSNEKCTFKQIHEKLRNEEDVLLNDVIHVIDTISKSENNFSRIEWDYENKYILERFKKFVEQIQAFGVDGDNYLESSFIIRLARTFTENEWVLLDFPVTITSITIADDCPLPLKITDLKKTTDAGLLNYKILAFDSDGLNAATVLAAQYAKRVTVHFSLQGEDKSHQPESFSVSSQGVGGTLSHVMRAINLAVLSDIKGLNEYYLAAHDILIRHDILYNNLPSPIWSHSLVRLCHRDVLATALSQSVPTQIQSYQNHLITDTTGRADYYGFDLLLTPAIASLLARLRAVKHTGIQPAQYRAELRKRVQQINGARRAFSCIKSYPFSSLALESQIFDLVQNEKIKEINLDTPQWLLAAYLTIAETFLQEGWYRNAYIYLQKLDAAFKMPASQIDAWCKQFKSGNKSTLGNKDVNFFGALLVRYQLCWATYYYLFDLEKEREDKTQYYYGDLKEKSDINQRLLIDYSQELLNKAHDFLEFRSVRYRCINESSQATSHPHYRLLAHIYWLRGRILLNFPHYGVISRKYLITEPSEFDPRDRLLENIQRGFLYCFEQARLYSASDGASDIYAYITAQQCCTYLRLSFQSNDVLRRIADNFDQGKCLEWARRLRNHALKSYASIGRACYLEIKQKSGVRGNFDSGEASILNEQDYESYGASCKVQRIPAIRELDGAGGLRDKLPGFDEVEGVLYLDMNILKVPSYKISAPQADMGEDIYLFGPNASHILFARGLYHLCSNDTEEFNASSRTRHNLKSSEWAKKLQWAELLFAYAGAFADDGAIATKVGSFIRIERQELSAARSLHSDLVAKSAASVRDLYPVGVGEIAALSKLFAAVCRVLHCYASGTLASGDFDSDALLADIYQKNPLQRSKMADYACSQPRFNGHLTVHIEDCVSHLATKYSELQRDGNLDIEARRNQILKYIFDSPSNKLR